jgi:thiol:disulfide interchange protein DsbD
LIEPYERTCGHPRSRRGIRRAEDDLLPPEQAFKFSARWSSRVARVRYRIADGYYMYRDKFRFSAQPAGAAWASPASAGKIKQDEYFGKVETYRMRSRFGFR